MKKRKNIKNMSVFTSLFLILCTVINIITPLASLAAGTGESSVNNSIVIDAEKSDWEDIEPVADTSGTVGFENFNINGLHLTNDEENLYFWVDAEGIADWGENGFYIDLALQINEDDSKNKNNPWSSQFDYSGMGKKPRYHVLFRIKNDKEINYVALAKANNDEGFESVFEGKAQDSWQGSDFAVNREVGFEGSIPLSVLGISDSDSIRAHVTLSGNNSQEHGAFDTIPRGINVIAKDWNESTSINTQSEYTNPYIVHGATLESPFIRYDGKVKFSYQGSGDENTVRVAGDFTNWSDNAVHMIKDENTNIWSCSMELQAGIYEYKFIVGDNYWITDPANEETHANGNSKLTVPGILIESPVINEDGTVTFNYQGNEDTETVYVPGGFNGWDATDNNPFKMTEGDDYLWSYNVDLSAGIYEYKYIVNGGWILDPANPNTNNGNSALTIPGLIIKTQDSVEKASRTNLDSIFIDESGVESNVTASYELEENVAGVSIDNNQLLVDGSVAADTVITIIASYNGYKARKKITVLNVLYDYTINYYRYDGKEMDWDMWIWEDGKDGELYPFTKEAEGGFAQGNVSATSAKINLITRPGNWSEQETDRIIEIPDGQTSVEAWVIQGVNEVFYSREEADVSESVLSAIMDSSSQIKATTTTVVDDDQVDSFKLLTKDSNGEERIIETENQKTGNNEIILSVKNPELIDVSTLYTVAATGLKAAKVTMRGILDDDKYYYDGDDLGLTYSTTDSQFRVWAPTAEKVSLALYDEAGEYNENGLVIDHSNGTETPMIKKQQGIWDLVHSGDLNNKYYMYKVEFADGTVNYSVDPYACAVSANGQKTAIVNLDKTDPAGFRSSGKPSMIEATDAIIYELHVRDFSIDENSGVSAKNKGKFLAFTEEGTINSTGDPTGIDHLKDLGVTHVHLLPVYDFQTVNELEVDNPDSTQAKFNWGYDPQNFNVPEGSYSTNPSDPASRINEFKQMVEALHANDIRVVMDVVYNHTYITEGSNFNNIVPGYYFRTDDTGKFTNGSGTGNEVASERPMVRKYIKDSVRYWAEEYDVDGFRFDLMGLIDIETMTQIEEELHNEIDQEILIYGEPWQAGGSVLPEYMQTTKGSQKDKNFAVFNDNFRGAVKGGSDDASKGFATGEPGKEADVVTGIRGAIDDFTNSPTETINYVTAHDNLNLWDKVIKTQGLEAVEAATPHATITEDNVLDNETVRRSLLANGIIMTSQGIPFIHAGDEILRTKYGDHNSYRSPDAINQIRWDDKTAYNAVHDYYKGLIELRKEHPAFRMSTADMVNENLEILNQSDNLVSFQLKNNANGDRWNNIVVIYNGNTIAKNVSLPNSSWKVVVNDQKAGTKVLDIVSGANVNVEALSVMVLYDEAKEYEPIATTISMEPKEALIEVGDSFAISYLVRDQNGAAMANIDIDWASSDESVARVTNGRITAIANGQATITASTGEVSKSMEIKVDRKVAEKIEIVGSDYVYVGSYKQLQAKVLDQLGQDFTTIKVSWESSDTSIATVNSSGKVTGKKPGYVVITATAGDISSSIEMEVRESIDRYIEVKYIRKDNDYTDWSLWLWQSGKSDGDLVFEEVTDEYAIARFPISTESENVGFALHKTINGDPWAEKDAWGADRFIQTDLTQALTKVTIYEGMEKIRVIPSLHGPELVDGNATFFYRDQKLYEENKMTDIETVSLKLQQVDETGNSIEETKNYQMEYDSENEYFVYKVENLNEGSYKYTFLIKMKDGTTKEVSDPFNSRDGQSTITYSLPRISSSVKINSDKITAGDSAVISVNIDNPENAGILNVYIDASTIGGSEKTEVDQSLMEQTITVDINATAGRKLLKTIIIDEFGNKHEDSFEVEVLTKIYDGSKTDFDWDEAVIYFLLTDRFANGDFSNDDPNGQGYDTNHPETYHGGDFQGIIDNLDYLENLGVNTIWISPIVDNIDINLREDKGESQYGYHGYWAKDFTQIDEHLGDLETFKKLIDEAHDHGIKIMVDVVLNHAGYGMEGSEDFEGMFREDPIDADPIKQELAGLPDFKTEDPQVREAIINWQKNWLLASKTNRGDTIDYFRVDTVKHVEDTTWKEFKNQLTEIIPSFKLIGEYYGGTIDNTGAYLGAGGMDSLLDFGFKDIASNFINGNIEESEEKLVNRNSKISYNQMMAQFLSSHDEDGFLLTRANNDENLFKVAASLQLTAKGQPVIYYGEEIGMSGKTAGNMDAGEFSENRDDFDWDATKDNELLEHYRKLLSIRAEYSKVFARGDRITLSGDNKTGYSIFSRNYNGETVIVALNTKDTEEKATFITNSKVGTVMRDIYGGGTYTVYEDQKVTVTLPAIEDGGTLVLVEEAINVEDPSETEKEPSKPGDPSEAEKEPSKPEEKPSEKNEEEAMKTPEENTKKSNKKTPRGSDKGTSKTKTKRPSTSKKEESYQISTRKETPAELNVEVFTSKQFDKLVYLSIKLTKLPNENDILKMIEKDVQGLIMNIIGSYDIELLDEDGNKISHIAEGLEITLTLQENIIGKVLIYHQKDDGTYEKIAVKAIDGQRITFIAYDFSNYIFVMIDDEPKEEELKEESSKKEDVKELTADEVTADEADKDADKATGKKADKPKQEDKFLIIGLTIVLIIAIVSGSVFIIKRKKKNG